MITDTLQGKFKYIIFHSEDSLYTVAKFQDNKQAKLLTVTGYFHHLDEEQEYKLDGHYVDHLKFGLQFSCFKYEKVQDNDEKGLIKYLSSSYFQYIGEKTAQKIVSTLGLSCLQMIKENADCLKQVPSLSKKQKESIIKGILKDDDSLEKIIPLLSASGIGQRNIMAIYHFYGDEAYAKIIANPYRLIEDIYGIGFKTADKIGQQIGIAKDDERRIYAYLIALVNNLTMQRGDSYVLYDDLAYKFRAQSHLNNSLFTKIISKIVFNNALIAEENRLYPCLQYEAEKGISQILQTFPKEKLASCNDELLKNEINHLEKDLNIKYDEIQIAAIYHFFKNDFMILTGGPGSGKTTLLRAFVALFNKMYPLLKIVCCAPTGRAAKRLNEVANVNTSTIHSLLQWNLESNEFQRNEDNPIDADVLIIDEFSMVDQYLFYRVLLAAGKLKKICVVGDEDQLPSVSPGSLLHDLIHCHKYAYQKLSYIYRQKEGSEVIQLSNDLRLEKVNLSIFRKDVTFLACLEQMIRPIIQREINTALQNGFTLEDIQVISPMYQGTAGIDALNVSLQEVFNPPTKEKKQIQLMSRILRVGDKVLQLKNQPEKDIYNGDIGFINDIKLEDKAKHQEFSLYVTFNDHIVTYKWENLDELTLAYCISIHKAQGSEYPIVIMAISLQHKIMLKKRLLYTAITRSSRYLKLVGNEEAFLNGIHIVEKKERKTTLQARLIQKEENLW